MIDNLHPDNADFLHVAMATPEFVTGICAECGAESAKEAETRCHCGGDRDSCAGEALWPDADSPTRGTE